MLARLLRLIGHHGDAHRQLLDRRRHVGRRIVLRVRILRNLVGRAIDLVGQLRHSLSDALNFAKARSQARQQFEQRRVTISSVRTSIERVKSSSLAVWVIAATLPQWPRNRTAEKETHDTDQQRQLLPPIS